MALDAGFQYLEQRDSNDNIVKQGVVSKKQPFANSNNTGIYDVIAENFRSLKESGNTINASVNSIIASLASQSSQIATKVSKSGDTISGSIVHSNNMAIKKNTNNGFVIFCGGNEEYYGGQVKLWGNNASLGGNAGRILLEACDGSVSKSSQLNLYPNGCLDLNGKLLATQEYVNNKVEKKGTWTPKNVKSYMSERCVYRVVGKVLCVWFVGEVNSLDENITICNSISNTFGVTAISTLTFSIGYYGSPLKFCRIVQSCEDIRLEKGLSTDTGGGDVYGHIIIPLV